MSDIDTILFFVMRLLSELVMKDRLFTGVLAALLIFLSIDHPFVLRGLLGFLLVIGLLTLNVDRISAWNEKHLKGRGKLPGSKRYKGNEEDYDNK